MMLWINILGYAASISVLATFCMSTMLPLRVAALSSNVLFSVYGAVAHIYPVLLLHVVLFPVNAARVVQIVRLQRAARTPSEIENVIQQLIPMMIRREVRAGAVLLRKGDPADRLYYLASGIVVVSEKGEVLAGPTILGEIGLFAPDRRRTLSIAAETDCVLFELSEHKVRELYFQNPAFAYAVLQIIVTRLLRDGRAGVHADPRSGTAEVPDR